MRRAEMARRRKNLSEKRNEEEKVHANTFNIHWRTTANVNNRWTQLIDC